MTNNIVLKQKISEFDDELSDQALDRMGGSEFRPSAACGPFMGPGAYCACVGLAPDKER